MDPVSLGQNGPKVTPPEETLKAFEALMSAGKILAIGDIRSFCDKRG